MNKSISLLLLIIPITLHSMDLSKKEVLQHAFEHAEDLLLIKKEILSAQSMEKEYRGKGLPTIEASLNYKNAPKQFSPYSFGMGGASGDGVSSGLNQDLPGYENDAQIAGTLDYLLNSFSSIDLTPAPNTIAMELSLKQPIFAQGKIKTGLKIAQKYYTSLDLKYKDTQLSIAKDIINAYNGALLAKQNRKVQKEAVDLAEETHRLTIARLESGKGNVLDTLNSRYSLQQSKLTLRDAEKNYYMAIRNLLTLASMDANPDDINLTDSLVIIDFGVDKQDALQQLTFKNTSIQQINKGMELQQLQTKLAKSDFLPTVYAGASASKISMFNAGDELTWGDDQKIFVGATIPIYSGGQKIHKVRQATYEEQKIEEKKKKAISQLNLALSNYYEELALAKEECSEAKHLITLTTQGAEIASLSYEIGQITQIDLTNSRQRLSESQLKYNSAVHKLNTAIVGIKMLLGDESLLTAEMEENK